MNKALFYTCTVLALVLFGSSFADLFSKWSEAMQALAIVLLLAGLRAATPKPLTNNRN